MTYKCLCGKTIRKTGEIQCSACRKNRNLSTQMKIPKVFNYSSPARTCLCGKKIRDNMQIFCSVCRKKQGY